MKKRLIPLAIIVAVLIIVSVYYLNSYLKEINPPRDSQICAQIITSARNPKTGDCTVFPTPCDVPDGWEQVNDCTASETN